MPTSIDLPTFPSDLAALLASPWSPRFDLDITFQTDLGVTYFDARAIPVLAKRMFLLWMYLRDWVGKAQARGGTVYVVFLTRRKMYTSVGGMEGLERSEEEWGEELQGSLGELCAGQRQLWQYERMQKRQEMLVRHVCGWTCRCKK